MSKLYSKEPFKVDRLACTLAGKKLSKYQAVSEDSLWSDWPKEKQFFFKLIFIAICHEFNWDFLQNTLAKKISDDSTLLSVDFIKQIDARTINNWLSDYHKPERIRASERAALLRDLGSCIIERFNGNPYGVIEESNGCLGGSKGFYELLDTFCAYREDPLRKKSNVLVHDLVRENIATFKDSEKIRPAIEYHIMRLYTRTGRIVPQNKELDQALLQGKPLPRWFVDAERKAVEEAMDYTAGAARKLIPDINYVEWQIARAICIEGKPRCVKYKTAPRGLPVDIKRLFKGSCPYISFCASYLDKRLIKIKEPSPRKKKSFY